MRNLDELRKRQQEIEAQIKEAEEEELREREKEVVKKIDSLTSEQKKNILSVIKHDRTSCSDEHPRNGFGTASNGGFRCRKCALMEILNGEQGGFYDFDFNVDINEVLK